MVDLSRDLLRYRCSSDFNMRWKNSFGYYKNEPIYIHYCQGNTFLGQNRHGEVHDDINTEHLSTIARPVTFINCKEGIVWPVRYPLRKQKQGFSLEYVQLRYLIGHCTISKRDVFDMMDRNYPTFDEVIKGKQSLAFSPNLAVIHRQNSKILFFKEEGVGFIRDKNISLIKQIPSVTFESLLKRVGDYNVKQLSK